MHWRGDDHVLALRLAAVLDWHLTESRRTGGAFDDPGCRLYPVEIVAIRNVRRWLDLTSPKVDHALMATNLGTMAPRTPWPGDELVRRLSRTLL